MSAADNSDALDGAQVLADRLEQAGDPRSPLLALELAAARAEEADEARRLHRAVQERRDADPDVAWPPALARTQTRLHAGLIVDGDYADLRAAQVPFEQLVSARWLKIPSGEVDDVLERLAALRPRGLAPEVLFEVPAPSSETINGRGFRTFAEGGGSLPHTLFVYGQLVDARALAGWIGLTKLHLDDIIREAEVLEALAPLGLAELPRISAHLVPKLVECFADSLTSLNVPEPQTDLEGFRAMLELPKLRDLSIQTARGPTPEVLEIVASHPGIEELSVQSLRSADLEVLEPMALRELRLIHVTTSLVAALPRLQSLQSLTVLGGDSDIGPLSELGQLRTLDLMVRAQGQLRLPPMMERLTISNMFGRLRRRRDPAPAPLRLSGVARLDSLALEQSCPVECEPRLLEQLRSLTFSSFHGSGHPLLDGLSSSCPVLEHLGIEPSVASASTTAPLGPPLGWREGPRVLRSLSQLRTVSIHGQTVAEQAWLNAQFPELAFSPSRYWPQVAAPLDG